MAQSRAEGKVTRASPVDGRVERKHFQWLEFAGGEVVSFCPVSPQDVWCYSGL